MNLQQLRYVVATADEGTMTQAAAALHVAQPALSQQVKQLALGGALLGVMWNSRIGRNL